MTAVIFFGEIVIASLLAVVLLAISPLGTTSASELFIGGVVVWTFVEYIVHRFVLHDFVPTRHGMHHANPDKPVLTSFWRIWACFALVYLIAGGAFLAGALGAYAWYLSCITVLPSLLMHHKNHRRFASRNYGVRTTLGTIYSGRCCADGICGAWLGRAHRQKMLTRLTRPVRPRHAALPPGFGASPATALRLPRRESA